MSSVIIAVDLAKHVFELAVSTGAGRITERKRLSRSQFERFWSDRPPCRVVMEACSSSHYWGRRLRALGFDVVLLPPHYVRPYVRRNKTDRTDCEALLEALRCAGIHPVAIKSEDQQAIAALRAGSFPDPLSVGWQFLATILLYPFSHRLIERFEDADVRFR